MTKLTKATLILGILFTLIPASVYLIYNTETKPSFTPKIVEFFSPETIGFFTPEKLEASHLFSNYSILNSTSTQILKQVENTPHKIVINLSNTLFIRKTPEELNNVVLYNNSAHTKHLPPAPTPKLYKPLDVKALENTLNTLFNELKQYKTTIQAFLVADEPYLNGISKQDLEIVINIIKQQQQVGLTQIPLWVNFAGALFNSQFASLVDQNLGKYVYNLDRYYLKQSQSEPSMTKEQKQEFNNWKTIIKTHRLVSYDQAGNLYTQGGLPKGIDLVSFDFYLSTLLFDEMYQNALVWFENTQNIASCLPFKNTSMPDIKKQLSFLQDGPVSAKLKQDKHLLNQLFHCRMEATTQLLIQQIAKDYPPENMPSIIMIAESSSNAFFERDKRDQIEADQPELLVEQRAYNEVNRYINYQQRNPFIFNSGIAYFLYPNTYDSSIKLEIKGTQDLPSVKSLIQNDYNESPL